MERHRNHLPLREEMKHLSSQHSSALFCKVRQWKDLQPVKIIGDTGQLAKARHQMKEEQEKLQFREKAQLLQRSIHATGS